MHHRGDDTVQSRTRNAILAALIVVLMGSKPAAPRLQDAAPSADALIARFLGALERKDAAALRRLRVTEDEYLKIILPGSVEKGQPLRKWPDEVCRYFWSEINAKSLYSEEYLLGTWGGHTYQIKSVDYDRGTKEYASYTAHRQLRLTVVRDDGEEGVLATGSIAELGGQFKFLSFKRD